MISSICQNCGNETIKVSEFEAKYFRKNKDNIREGSILVCELCERCFSGRNEASNKILECNEDKRLIVAGPGTGKSFTFSQVLKNLPSGSTAVAFTLINNLVNELEKDLGSIEGKDIQVNTLHGFCKQLLHSQVRQEDINDSFIYFPLLSSIIEEDSVLLGFNFTKKDFGSSFAQVNEGAQLKFYINRGSYYNSVSHEDSIYRVFDFYRSNKNLIPSYDMVIVDEYQDFNPLEARFINLLAEKSKILIAGDDDQALYKFRDASTDYIRGLHKDGSFKNHQLPFCSRCTPVLVESTNYFIKKVQEAGLLNERIARDFECYWPDKYHEHNNYPIIDVARCATFSPTALKFVTKRIEKISSDEQMNGEEKDIQFIIIGPESHYHLNQVKEYLSTNLDNTKYEIIDSRPEKQEILIEAGYRILKNEKNKNLGWRIVLHKDPLPNMVEIIKKTHESNVQLEELLPDSYKEKHISVLNNMSEETQAEEIKEETKRIRVLLTNYYGSKGLSALHSIIVGLNNFDFPLNPESIQDTEICKFIVALTRAKNSCCLVTNKNYETKIKGMVDRPSIFISWLPQDKLKVVQYKSSDL